MKKTKQFLKISELIEHIKSKGIKIKDEEKVKRILTRNNYYVITGYKNLFLDDNHNYVKNVYFENIYNLYLFDRKLKLLLLSSLLDIENIIKTAITNRFCEKYGFKERDYLNPYNYNINHKYLKKTFKIFYKQIEETSKNNIAITYYKEIYGFVPFWVMTKAISFGIIKEIYGILKDDDKIAIKNEISNFNDIKIKGLFTAIQLLVDIRNKIAHDEIVYNISHKKIILPRFNEYNRYKLENNSGLNNLFGVLISVKNIQDKVRFNKLIDNINNLINEYVKENKIITKKALVREMGLPSNFKKLKWKLK